MEPEVRAFFAKIVKSMSLAVLWLLTHMTLGIFFDLGFIHESISVVNILYYIFLLGTFTVLVWYLLKLWKENLQA